MFQITISENMFSTKRHSEKEKKGGENVYLTSTIRPLEGCFKGWIGSLMTIALITLTKWIK